MFALRTPGQFVGPDLVEGWEPAQLLPEGLQLNLRVSEEQPLPEQYEALQAGLDPLRRPCRR